MGGQSRYRDSSAGSGQRETLAAVVPRSPLQTLGRYQLLDKIGSGGFGTVYKAWDPLIQRAVAIKTCEVRSEEVRARFFREACLAGGLQHPNITTIHELGVERDTPYLVQEFLPGADLDRIIARPRPLSLLEKLDVLIGVASGLQYAHASGVIHRDIKPSNVRVLEDGSVKIMDFGIARSLHGGGCDLTKAGVTVGSSAYMSPEQARGETLDARSDLFSFGASPTSCSPVESLSASPTWSSCSR